VPRQMALDYPDFYTRARLKGYESRVIRYNKDLANGEIVTVVELPGFDLELETLEWATRVQGDPEGGVGSLIMYLETYDVENQPSDYLMLAVADAVTLGWAALTPASLNKWKSDLFELLNYDTANSRYKIGLRRRTRFSNGIRIRFWNRFTGTDQRVVMQAVVTLIGE